MIDHPLHASVAARLLVATTLLTTIAACGTAPLSYLSDRQVSDRAVLHRVPLVVDAVDGISTAFRPVPISPGPHLVTMHAPPVAGFSSSIDRTIPMSIEPCTNYYIAGQRPSALSQDWTLVVERTYSVAACNKEEELHKARARADATPAGTPTAASTAVSLSSTPVARAAPD